MFPREGTTRTTLRSNPRVPHPDSGSFTPVLTQRGGKARARGGRTGQGLLGLGKGGVHRHHPCSAPRAAGVGLRGVPASASQLLRPEQRLQLALREGLSSLFSAVSRPNPRTQHQVTRNPTLWQLYALALHPSTSTSAHQWSGKVAFSRCFHSGPGLGFCSCPPKS